ncbi:MAG: T9SS type A sorting domain-containing protein [Melioribacteraceae bacterium]|nr:T9SS type A sorting domain-containing protein [Melioribacteraceae bacterium]
MKKLIFIIGILLTSNNIAQQRFPPAPEIWSEPVLLDSSFARQYFWEESPSLSSNMDTIYFDRGNGVIHTAIKRDDKWQPSIKLNDNINGFVSKYRPSISKDGKRLYLSVWAGYGGWDVWYSDWNYDIGDWGTAYNMGAVINNPGDQMYLYEVNKDTVFCLSYGGTNLYSWNYQENSWTKIDSFWYHELGVGDKMGLSMTENKKKIYFARGFYNSPEPYNIDILVTYWDSTSNYWGDVYSLNINTEPTFSPDSSHTYGGGEYDPWISPDGKIIIFASNRDAEYDSINTDNATDIYISYLLVDEDGNPVSVQNEDLSDKSLNESCKIFSYPNPFNSSTTIQYELPVESSVTIKLYDSLGREITTILNEKKEAGKHKTALDFKNYKLSSGLYFCTLYTKSAVITNKLIYLK